MQPYRLKRGVGYCHHKKIKKAARIKTMEQEVEVEDFPNKPCVFCGVMLESAFPDGDWSTLQPYRGGEVQFHFSYGSTKFDNNIGSTVFRGLICDECGEKFVERMSVSNGL